MATITFKDKPVQTVGELPKVGSKAPSFRLTRADLSELSLSDLAGKKKLLNIVPSLDTGVCAASTRRFSQEASKVKNAALLTISRDLPFAQKRFCDAEGITGVTTLSAMRDTDFGQAYGVTMADGPLATLFSRAVVILDENDKVIYTEQVPEIAQEPDYPKALAALGA